MAQYVTGCGGNGSGNMPPVVTLVATPVSVSASAQPGIASTTQIGNASATSVFAQFTPPWFASYAMRKSYVTETV